MNLQELSVLMQENVHRVNSSFDSWFPLDVNYHQDDQYEFITAFYRDYSGYDINMIIESITEITSDGDIMCLDDRGNIVVVEIFVKRTNFS